MSATIDGLEILAWSVDADRLRARFAVAPNSAFFAGHFPSRPIFPAVGQLLLVETCAASAFAGEQATGIEAARFKLPLGPGDEIELTVEPGRRAGALAFRITGRAGLVSSGSLTLGRGQAAAAEPAPPGPVAAHAPLDLAELLPQRSPALLIERILASGAGAIRCAVAVPVGSPLALAGGLSAVAAIECAAQAAAALEGLGRRARGAHGRRTEGLLVACRAARLGVRVLPPGSEVEVEHLADAGPLHDYRGRIEHGGRVLAEASVATYAEA